VATRGARTDDVQTQISPLGHAGRWLTDAGGRVVVLHGVNLVNKLPPYHPAAMGFDESHARFLAEQGFNTVRLGLIWKAIEPGPGQYDSAYLDSIAETVSLLGGLGLHVLVDFHQDMYNERFNGEGAPDWAVQDDAVRAWPDIGFPGNYAVMRALWRAYDHFWANDPGPGGVGLQDRYASAWRHVAARFRDEPAVFGYDIFNEPFPGSAVIRCLRPGGSPRFDRRLSDFSRRVLDAIRAVDVRKLVFYEPHVLFDYGVDTHHEDLRDPAVGFSFHDYCLAASPGMPHLPGRLQDVACEKQEQRVFDQAERHSRRTGAALLLSEFGATDDLRTVDRAAELADRNMVSWQYWAYFNRDPCCERPEEGIVRDLTAAPNGDNVKESKLDVLVRPFPRAVSGTPTRLSFDRHSGRFELSYSTRAPDGGYAQEGLTEVFIPTRHYRHGYRAQAQGAQVVSTADAVVLRLAADPDAESVSVRVCPS
jgi:endoglycosylceramidase